MVQYKAFTRTQPSLVSGLLESCLFPPCCTDSHEERGFS